MYAKASSLIDKATKYLTNPTKWVIRETKPILGRL
jgi:hypothetical protein